MYLAKSPAIIKKYYSALVWDIPNDKNNIFLTFDDGPIPGVTEWVLDVLKQYNVKATFFCIGDNVANHSAVYQRTIAEGHAVGNHTFNHLNGWKTRSETYLANVQYCQEMVDSKLFRPPYGKIKQSQLKVINRHYSIVMWDVLSGDYDQKTTPEKCYENVVSNVRSGSIIVFHDSIKAEKNLKYALPRVIEYLLEQGFVFEVLK